MIARRPGCSFCDADRLEPQLLAETRSFALAADRAPLRAGHLVLVPRAHMASFADLPETAWSELRALVERAAALLEGEPRSATVTAFGRVTPPADEHPHLHLLPDPDGALAAALGLERGQSVAAPADLRASGRGTLLAWRTGQAWLLPAAGRGDVGTRAWLARVLAEQGVLRPREDGLEAARRWRWAWQRFNRERGGPPQRVVTCFLRRQGRICLFRRSPTLESAPGKWHGVSGYLPEGADPLEHALEEIGEETGLSARQLRLARAGRPVPLGEPPDRPPWLVYPFLFDLLAGEPRLNWEHQDLAWIEPAELRRYDTVAWLPLVYAQVAG